jgi:hypothetical protein
VFFCIIWQVVQSLDDFLAYEELSGGNQYKCSVNLVVLANHSSRFLPIAFLGERFREAPVVAAGLLACCLVSGRIIHATRRGW